MILISNTKIPLYKQLKEELKNSIKKGTLIHGEKIPTEIELSEIYKVSRITIRKAVEELVKEGLLLKKQGKGTFVQQNKIQRKIDNLLSFTESCEINGMIPSSIVTKKEILIPTEEQIEEMGLKKSEKVLFIQRIRLADGFPIMCENNYFPYPKFEFLISEALNTSLYSLLKDKYGIKVDSSNNSYIDIVCAGSDIAPLMQLSNGEPLFFLYTQMYDDKKKLIHIGKQFINSEHYRFHLNNIQYSK